MASKWLKNKPKNETFLGSSPQIPLWGFQRPKTPQLLGNSLTRVPLACCASRVFIFNVDTNFSYFNHWSTAPGFFPSAVPDWNIYHAHLKFIIAVWKSQGIFKILLGKNTPTKFGQPWILMTKLIFPLWRVMVKTIDFRTLLQISYNFLLCIGGW